MLDKVPRNPWHVGWTSGEDFPILMEELDERAFLCRDQVDRDGHSLVWFCWVDPNFFGIPHGVESMIWQGSTHVG
jgi:hypothetical protein